jgi:4-hydroxy-tetrahydrodipicolinate synthase
MADAARINGGIIAAAVTPRRPHDHAIDIAAALDVLDFLSSHGVDGIAVLGSTGEFVHFDADDRCRLVSFAAKRSRVPILANVSHSTLDGAIQLGQEAASSGAAGLLLTPPYYFRYSQEAVRAFCLRFAEAVGRETPLYLYNIPMFTTEIGIETARALLSTGRFAGIKDSGGVYTYVEALLAHRQSQPFQIFVGQDEFLTKTRLLGVDGGVSGVACAVPELMVRLDRAIREGDQVLTATLDERLQQFLGWIERFPAPVGINAAVKQRRVPAPGLACPLGEQDERALDEFGGWFKDWLPDVLKECKR